MKNVRIITDLPPQEAMALAQFCKRVGFNELRANSIDTDEAYVMQDSIAKLQKSLAEAGYAPR